MIVQDTSARFLDRTRLLMERLQPRVATQILVYTPGELAAIADRPFVRHEMLGKGKGVPVDPLGDARRWLEFAAEDVRMAPLASRERIWNQVCFHAQQAVEKCLKALLAAEGQLLPRTHVIAESWNAQTAPMRDSFADLQAELVALDRFYIPTRYPDALPGATAEGLPTEADASEALALADACLQRTRPFIVPGSTRAN